jgi:AhpD family alkylhydroperoxidase
MFGLETYIQGVSLKPKLKELIKIRASQLNGCAYCIQMHTTQAREQGESEQRIYALSAWSESPLFSAEERAVLALTDEITQISAQGLSQETYDLGLNILGEHGLAQSIVQIVTINAWNRIAVSTHMRHKSA